MFFKKDVTVKVEKILKSFALTRYYKVLRDINLEYKGKTAHIDCLMVGYFGVLFVSAYDLKKAQLFGGENEDKWVVLDGDKKTAVNNLYKQNIENNAFLREVFSSEKIYSIPFENAVCVDCKDDIKQINANVNSMTILTLKQLKKHIRKLKFEKDNGVQIDKIINCIEKHKK